MAAIEGTYEIVNVEKSGWGLAWYSIVDLATDDAATSDVCFGPILMFHMGKFDLVTNTYVVRSFGDNKTAGVDISYTWLVLYELTSHLKIGVEGEGGLPDVFHVSPGDGQTHTVGPAIFMEFDVGGSVVTVDLGLQFGLSDPACDTAAKVIVGTVF